MNIDWAILIPTLSMIAILVWGLRLITSALSYVHTDPDNTPVITQVLSEGNSGSDKPSFSRIAGLMGAIILSAFSVGLGLFLLIALATDRTGSISIIDEISNYFLAMTAMFAPYAVNQLGRLFQGTTSPSSSTKN
ncbi:MAG: hypothetical protein AAF217_06095 [Pseudomonadota bacterium]